MLELGVLICHILNCRCVLTLDVLNHTSPETEILHLWGRGGLNSGTYELEHMTPVPQFWFCIACSMTSMLCVGDCGFHNW